MTQPKPEDWEARAREIIRGWKVAGYGKKTPATHLECLVYSFAAILRQVDEQARKEAFEKTKRACADVLVGLQKTAYSEDEVSLFTVIEGVIMDMPFSALSSRGQGGS